MTRIAAALVASSLSLAASFAQAQSGKILDKTYNTAAGRPELQVVVDDSSVRAQSCGSCREVRIHVDTRDMNLSDFRLSEMQSGNIIRFSFKRPDGSHWDFGRRRWPEITVMVPAESDVSLHSGDGALNLAGVHGRVDVRSGDGAISVAETQGALHVAAGDGSINLQRVEGSLNATTGDGAIHGEGRFVQLDARTGDGSVNLTALDGSSLTNGVRITTGDGAVNLRVPRSVHADVDLRAGDGSVRCELPLATQASSNQHAIHGSVNGGGNSIRITTGDGSINLGGL